MLGGLEDPERLRADLRTFLAVEATPPAPTVKVLSSVRDEGFTRQLVQLETDDDRIPALLAVPAGKGPFPAVVVFHQHAGQRHFGKSEVFGLVGDRFQAFGPPLVRAGLVVLCPDSIAFEDRRPGGPGTDVREDDREQHYNALANRLVSGATLMQKVLQDAMTAVSAVLGRPDVDADAIGALGHSYGGNTTLFLTAVDERVRFGCASGAVGSYRRKVADGTGIEMAEVIPGFAARFDIEHLLAAIAPRPFLVVSGTADRYAADAEELVGLAKQAYRSAGAEAALTHVQIAGEHALDVERFTAIVGWTTQTAAIAHRVGR
jgi:dienelactone hydrolase